MVTLAQALRVDQASCVALVGSGGKTTALFQLASQVGSRAWVTTTTHLGVHQATLAAHHRVILDETNLPGILDLEGVVLVTGDPTPESRLSAPPPQVLVELYRLAKQHGIPLLVEADGARGLPLKGHALHEPVVPDFSDLVVVLAGLAGLGAPLDGQVVHRPAEFSRLGELPEGGIITPEVLARVLCHPAGVLRGIPRETRKVVLLNQADDMNRQSAARGMVEVLFREYAGVIIASLGGVSPQVHAVHEPVAGIILAAGGGKRMGDQPKLVLPWQGHGLVWHVAEAARQAGLQPIRVVTGAWDQAVKAAVAGLPVEIIHNPGWVQGQSTSVRRGLESLPSSTGAVVFLLGDQPLVPPDLIRSLVETHAQTLAPIVVPEIDGRRGNPVLFDRVTFSAFSTLVGDVGGRGLFSRYRQAVVVWHDSRPLFDVDTLDDYEQLKSEM